MSGIVKGVKKVFKKVAKVVKKVLPIVLAAAAIYFTGGAALGLTGTWGAAVSSMTAQMGATSVLGNVLTGAITQAGYGAAAGGILSKLSGGSFSKGAQTGALAGAVSGGVMGGFGLGVGGGAEAGAEAAPAGAAAPVEGVEAAALEAPSAAADAVQQVGPLGSKVNGMLNFSRSLPPSGAAPIAPTTAAAPAAGGGNGIFAQGGWLERNQELVGNVVSGLGKGLVTGMAAQDKGEASLRKQREYLDWIRSNYSGSGRGLMSPGRSGSGVTPGLPTPTQRFDPAYASNGEYVYDPQAGRIVFVERA